MIDIKYIAKNYKVLVDTSALMYDFAEDFFLKTFSEILNEYGNRIIVPIQVISELIKSEKYHSNEERQKKGRIGAKIIKVYQDKNLLDIRSDKSDSSIPDHLFKLAANYHREKHNICLLTQDKGLTYDMYKLKKSASVQYKTDLRVFQLTQECQLEELSFDLLKKTIGEIECYVCKRVYTENKKRIETLKAQGKEYICYECRHVEIECPSCKKKKTETKSFIERLKMEGKEYICYECRNKKVKARCSICKENDMVKKFVLENLRIQGKRYVCDECRSNANTKHAQHSKKPQHSNPKQIYVYDPND